MSARARWTTIGAAAALIVAGGGVMIAAAASDGASTFVPITPCRLVDTRPAPDNVGPRATPLGPNETYVATVWGTNGNCAIPSTATAVSLNVTFVDPTSSGYLTIYPPDAAARPLTSNLNWTAGQAPGPNAVTTKLSSTGTLGFYNLAGTVQILADVVGYYEPAGSSDGSTGDVGAKGPTGDKGATGSTGIKGPIGDNGGKGQTGDIGATGNAGATAPVGAAFGRTIASSTVVDNINFTGRDTSIAIGTDGYPIVSFQDYADKGFTTQHRWLIVVKCLDRSCSTSMTPSVISTDSVGWYTAITIGADGNPIVAYYDVTTDQFKALFCPNPACAGITVSNLKAIGAGPTGITDSATSTVRRASSIAIGGDGNPIFTYSTFGATKTLVFVHCTSATCAGRDTRTIDSSSMDVGTGSSIAVNPAGNAVISYYDAANGDLKVATCNNSACSAPTITKVETTNNVGRDTSIAIGTDGFPVISYYDLTNTALRVAKCGDPTCTTRTIAVLDGAGAPDVGQYTSLAIAPNGNPAVSYYDATNKDLKLVTCNDPACSPTVNGAETVIAIDGADDVGQSSSLAFGRGARPTISYLDETLGALKVAIVTHSSWTVNGWGR